MYINILALVSLIKNFHLVGLEIVASSEQASSVIFSISVTRYLHVVVTQIRVRVAVGIGTISDVKIMAGSGSKCWTVAIVSIDSMLIVFDVKLERLQSIFVFKGK